MEYTKEQYLETQEKLFIFMDHSKKYLNKVEDPFQVVEDLYELDNFVSTELAQDIELELQIMEKIQDECPEIFC